MFTMIGGDSNVRGSQRQRSSVSSICRSRASKGRFRRAAVVGPTTPSGARPYRRWNACTPATSVASYSVSAAASGTGTLSGTSPRARSSRRSAPAPAYAVSARIRFGSPGNGTSPLSCASER